MALVLLLTNVRRLSGICSRLKRDLPFFSRVATDLRERVLTTTADEAKAVESLNAALNVADEAAAQGAATSADAANRADAAFSALATSVHSFVP